MQLYDQHLHSWNSFDCKTPPEENVLTAVGSGIRGLTFTEHFDTHPDEWPGCIYDDGRITAELAELRRKYPEDQVRIGKGIEVCWQPSRLDFILDFLSRHRFDVVLISVHWAGGRPVHVREGFDGLTGEEFILTYLQAVREATEAIAKLKKTGRQPFHVLGHLDFAKRYAKRYFDFEGPVHAPELIDAILMNCLEAGLIPEINTSTLRNSMAEPMPGPAVVRRYAELGGTMMSLGSDAHSSQYVGSHFDVALEIMRSAGLRHLAVFKEGQLAPEPL